MLAYLLGQAEGLSARQSLKTLCTSYVSVSSSQCADLSTHNLRSERGIHKAVGRPDICPRLREADIACLATLAWAVTGPVFNYSDTWQLVINTGTTVATFLMIFVLQHSQNRDATAIQAKLDELILESEASNKLIRAEQLTEEEVEELRCDPPELQEQRRALNDADIAI